MTTNKNYAFYAERGDLLERKALSEINHTGWYLQPQLDEINEQIRIIENVTTQAQKTYFESIIEPEGSDNSVSGQWSEHGYY